MKPFTSLSKIVTIFLLSAFACCHAFAQATFGQKARTFHSQSEFERSTGGRVNLERSLQIDWNGSKLIGGAKGLVIRDSAGNLGPFPKNTLLPSSEVTVLAADPQGKVWIGTTRGLIVVDGQNASRVQYFAGRRWLQDDRVSAIGFEKSGKADVAWVQTATGMTRIAFEPITLEYKAQTFEDRIRARHLRHGLTASSHLRTPGDLNSNQTVSSDNDGLWTAMYVVAECFRFAVTGSEEARANARTGMDAILRLETITGIKGFPARSFIKVGVDQQPTDGEWHATPDGQWRWKGDTSSDEIVGHYFVYPIYYDLIATPEEKARIRSVVERITTHIIDNKFQLIDADGKRTRWGWWAPDEIWKDADEVGLRALHLLSHLRVAAYLTSADNPALSSKYEAVYRDLIDKHKYDLLLRNQKINIPGHVNHSDDELAFLSYYPLLRYEKDPKLLEIYRESLTRAWQIERSERNPLWNFIFAAGTGEKTYDKEESVRTLREIPTDLISWTVSNSHRADVPRDQAMDRFDRAQSLIVLPYDELPVMKWNGNPYRLDGGDGGRSEDDGAFFLLPYWMGRYHKLIEP